MPGGAARRCRTSVQLASAAACGGSEACRACRAAGRVLVGWWAIVYRWDDDGDEAAASSSQPAVYQSVVGCRCRRLPSRLRSPVESLLVPEKLSA